MGTNTIKERFAHVIDKLTGMNGGGKLELKKMVERGEIDDVEASIIETYAVCEKIKRSIDRLSEAV
ncbi:MAG: hypothetical protein WC444_04360 [Candidatus Paceibacterota bacterium]